MFGIREKHHHEHAEQHVVVVDEEDELVSSGRKLGRHLEHEVLHLHLKRKGGGVDLMAMGDVSMLINYAHSDWLIAS